MIIHTSSRYGGRGLAVKYVMNCHKVHATGEWLNAGDERRGVQAMNLSLV